MYWNKLNRKEINEKVDRALQKNVSYAKGEVMGIPGTYLDQIEFNTDTSFLDDAPFLRTLVANPNHIGCHTLDKKGSPIFQGTHAIEKELIKLCGEEIFAAEENSVDGYVATGGTEANLEAMWIYRNYFMQEQGLESKEIGVIYSEDTHYSISKGSNLLQVPSFIIPVDTESRQMEIKDLEKSVEQAKKQGVKSFIVIVNLCTTMFGSVDEIDPIVAVLQKNKVEFKIHLDAAFGGFIYPFTNSNSVHNFSNKNVSSISIDGHKMLQAPYGTGLFLIRKGFMKYVTNDQAQYVPGLDYTLCGSRSGANAVVIWMLLKSYGSEGWVEKIAKILKRTDYVCERLDKMKVNYFRNPFVNIVTIKADSIPDVLGKKYELVADTYERNPEWWKIVVMEHVNYDLLKRFLDDLETQLKKDRALADCD